MSNTEYYEWAAKEYGLSVQSIKIIISKQKRIQAYKDAILIYENYEYKDANELCSYICGRCNELIADGKMYKRDAIKIIADETGYKPRNIERILSGLKKNGHAYLRKFPTAEIVNRDKAIYRDYIDWKKTEQEFWTFAVEKYKLKKQTLQIIINMMWEADPERYVNKTD